MHPLTVAFFTDTFLHNPNGVSSTLVLLRQELTRQGHAVWLVAPSLPGARTAEPGVVRIPSVPYPFYPAQRLGWPVGRVVRDRVDIVHAHTPFGIGLAAARFARRRRVPLVATLHVDYRSYRHYVPLLAPLDHRFGLVPRLLRRLYRDAEVVLVPSEAARSVAETCGIGRPTAVVPNGVDPAFLDAAPRIASPWPAGARRLLAVSRLGREKELALVLEALALPTTAAAHLVVVGEGPERQALLDRARDLGVADCLTILPPVPFAAIGGYYREAELFLSASPSETQGLAAWEAQAMGVPVVAVGLGGSAEAVRHGETGFLVARGDARAMARRIGELLADEERRLAVARRAREWASHGSIASMATALLAVYAEAARMHRRRTLHPPRSGC